MSYLFPQDPVKYLIKDGIRIDGRKFDELRPIKLTVGVLEKPNGSALIEFGKNKIIAGVYGPREVHPRHLAKQDTAVLRTTYMMSTFAVDERKSPAPSRREKELSMIIRQSLEPAIFLRYYPKTLIDVHIQVLCADGGTRCASIIAAALALADAGIFMSDLVTAVAVGKVQDENGQGHIVLDLSDIEDKEGWGDLPIAMMPRTRDITLLQFDGELSKEEMNQAIELAYKGIDKIYQLQNEALKAKYQMKDEESEDYIDDDIEMEGEE
ncbi:MAG: exosome complex exonuclease Rrp41 [Candidatus Lokiarchaeota archaeon]|nr:exosome complex exonuclease Rrp41 [Candidatus Lokiarchaeota archaeon]